MKGICNETFTHVQNIVMTKKSNLRVGMIIRCFGFVLCIAGRFGVAAVHGTTFSTIPTVYDLLF
jgi:hypothetical protein